MGYIFLFDICIVVIENIKIINNFLTIPVVNVFYGHVQGMEYGKSVVR